MLPVAEGDVVCGRVRELMLGPALARGRAHACEPEGVELVRVSVVNVAVVRRVR